MTEHTEDWCFADDHVVPLPFVSVQEDPRRQDLPLERHHNIDTLLSAAPAWWMEHVTGEWAKG